MQGFTAECKFCRYLGVFSAQAANQHGLNSNSTASLAIPSWRRAVRGGEDRRGSGGGDAPAGRRRRAPRRRALLGRVTTAPPAIRAGDPTGNARPFYGRPVIRASPSTTRERYGS
ncbi:hypothetical protein PVAP13_2NG593420 [Panicum virgatum]|uniref:Uncharacterized protein n=1 Tax=Panicum virgatum TaxID=38727 RepID=A0A8T0VQG1_PANVG|nr:hypothetical protein PVAP13_2NG593420 [Panicum virgatum]